MPNAYPIERIESLIHEVRGLRVMLDADLAGCYGVNTKVLNQAVRRNLHRFPEDFSFVLTAEEVINLRSQNVTSRSEAGKHGGRRYLPRVFTEHGAVMLASILNSAIAISTSVEIVRSFVKMRQAIQLSGADLAAKLAQIDVRLGDHDSTLSQVVSALNSLLNPPTKPSREIGFHAQEDETGDPTIAKLPRKNVRYQPARRARRKGKNS